MDDGTSLAVWTEGESALIRELGERLSPHAAELAEIWTRRLLGKIGYPLAESPEAFARLNELNRWFLESHLLHLCSGDLGKAFGENLQANLVLLRVQREEAPELRSNLSQLHLSLGISTAVILERIIQIYARDERLPALLLLYGRLALGLAEVVSLAFYEVRSEDLRRAEETAKEAEEQLRRAQKLDAIGRLAGGIAHDFNNRLTVILSSAALALAELPDGSAAGSRMIAITEAAERAAGLTRQLLAFASRQVVSPALVSLNDVILDLAAMIETIVREDIVLTIRLDEALWAVRIDRAQIEQVVTNLAMNARDAIGRSGHLTIETKNVSKRRNGASKARDYVRLTVSDDGVGMTAEVRAHIFEPFFTTKTTGGGQGLGLAACYGIVAQNGGEIEVTSEPGRGSGFSVYLPRVEEQRGPERDDDQPPRREVEGTETILLVDDQKEIREVVAYLLRKSGYTVLEAAGGADALSQAQAEPRRTIHLLLTDVMMPGMTGPDLAERFAALRGRAAVLYMSGYAEEALVHRGVLPPRTAFLEKPFSPTVLHDKIRAVLAGGGFDPASLEPRDSTSPMLRPLIANP